MTIKIKRFDESLPLPEYKSKKAAALDLYARVDTEVPAQQVVLVPLNVAIGLPKDHWVLLAARSSLSKKGLMLANGIGVGDEDYCGDQDEYKAAIFNFSKKAVQIEKGERIVQMIILPRQKVTVRGVKKLSAQNRGGFGSTGT